MKEKVLLITCAAAMGWAELGYAAEASSLQNRGQEMNNWCWAACSEMILDWDGTDTAQTNIADWAVSGANIGNYLDTGPSGIGPWRIPYTDIVIYRKGIKQVLDHFGNVQSEATRRALTLTEAQETLDENRPFIIAEYWAGGGGHVLVARDYSASLFSIEDPWPLDGQPQAGKNGVSATVDYDVLTGTDSVTYKEAVFGGSGGNTWGQTLVVGKALDIVFLIDSTGSMGSYIASVQSQATELLNSLNDDFSDLRVSVVEYRDYPEYPYGNSTDYITLVQTAFTTNIPDAVTAINAISVGGGADWEEAVFSAVYRTAVGSEIGGWREDNSVSRHIILMGDAPGHSPEEWTDGKSLSDCLGVLTDPDHPISVQAVHVSSDSDAAIDFAALADGSGGKKVSSVSSSDVVSAIEEVFEDIDNARYPVDETSNPYPVFSFSSMGGGTGNSPEFAKLKVEVETYDEKRGWKKYKQYKIKDLGATTLETTKMFKTGDYRWRLAGKTKSGKVTYPDGTKVKSEKLGKFVEEEFTEFTRVPNLPGTVTKGSYTTLYSETKTYEVYFEDEPAAEAFAIQVVLANGKTKVYVFKRKKLSEDESSGYLSAKLKVLPGEYFSWYIQGLNFDRRKPDDSAWN